MFQRLNHRPGHYAILMAVATGMFFINLGSPSLWDIDEGNNAEAAREMMEAWKGDNDWNDLVVPTFNFQLRVDKPALLYWLQIASYQLFGVNEFAARIPSALAALATLLIVYEFGRLLFNAGAGLLAGLVLASTPGFCASAHFANPDALLNALNTLGLFFFWRSYSRSGREWFVLCGICSGLAVLAKGPVGLILPLGVVGLFLLWSRQLRILLDRRLALGVLAVIVVAVPWYAWVGAETKGEFLRGFFLTHNYGRFVSTMENHRGSFLYYPLVLLVGFAPWSAFLCLAGWVALRPVLPKAPSGDSPQPFRFLWCWIGTYFLFFSLSSTKLPNYVLPLYPPLALVTAHFFDRWRRGLLRPPAWAFPVGLGSLALMGVAVSLGLLAAGGALPVHALRGGTLPGLEQGAVLGLLLVLAAAGGWWCLRRHERTQMVIIVASGAVLFVGGLAAWLGTALNPHKAPRELAGKIHAHPAERDFRVGCYEYFQPSLVFYSRRQVERLESQDDALDFLSSPLPVYLYMPGSVWDAWQANGGKAYHVLGRCRDFYKNCDVVVVTNR
jgi:4-amino-4-deoxy-L-arabinose transferase-like glycosyltransferase